jgi:hypothetical protein
MAAGDLLPRGEIAERIERWNIPEVDRVAFSIDKLSVAVEVSTVLGGRTVAARTSWGRARGAFTATKSSKVAFEAEPAAAKSRWASGGCTAREEGATGSTGAGGRATTLDGLGTAATGRGTSTSTAATTPAAASGAGSKPSVGALRTIGAGNFSIRNGVVEASRAAVAGEKDETGE